MIVPTVSPGAGSFRYATSDPKVGGRNRMQPVYYVSSQIATDLTAWLNLSDSLFQLVFALPRLSNTSNERGLCPINFARLRIM